MNPDSKNQKGGAILPKNNNKIKILNSRKRILKTALFIFFFFACFVSFANEREEALVQGAKLSLEDCTKIALENNPEIKSAEHNIELYKSLLGQSRSIFYPQINASGSGSYRTSPESGISVPGGVGGSLSKEPYEQYSFSISLNQLLFDFGKSYYQSRSTRLQLNSAEEELIQTRLQVIYNVRQAYYGILRAKRNLAVLNQSIAQLELHLKMAEALYQVGKSAKIDVTSAELNLSNGQLELIQGENNLKTAIATLNNVMGLTKRMEYDLVDELEAKKEQLGFETALERAYAQRPDLRALLEREKALEQLVKSARADYFPKLTASASYNWTGEDFPLSDYWALGLGLSVPIFNGFQTRNSVEQAKANLAILGSNLVLLKQKIYLEVESAYLKLEEAKKRILVAELAQRQAEENLSLANARYQAGAGSAIEVADAELKFSNAGLGYIQALYDYKLAESALEKAMGVGE